ncbi:6-phosphogluconolactonase [Candidatus Woesearchaeota archaeon]|nr:6-phosphogluconolactonase [Candidatus Woesearchaeota archaeon]
MITISSQDIKELNKKAVDILVDNISGLLEKQEHVIFGVVGGSSMSGIFNLLKHEKRIPWEKIHVFMADERFVLITNEESNFRLANETFVQNLPKENAHPFTDIAEYETELKKYGDSYDILLLSAGEDGHIASLFPNHTSINDDSDHFVMVKNSPKPPPERMSISRKMVLNSKTALILFLGEGKKHAYQRFLEQGDVYSCPARLVKSVENSYVFTNLR